MDTTELINERQTTHGDFRIGAAFTTSAMGHFMTMPSWTVMQPYQKEGAHMIIHKLQRIGAGDPNFVEHWDDIAGYATRVASILRGQS